jgi:hypothetical protein
VNSGASCFGTSCDGSPVKTPCYTALTPVLCRSDGSGDVTLCRPDARPPPLTPFSKSPPARTDFPVTMAGGQSTSGGVFERGDRRGGAASKVPSRPLGRFEPIFTPRLRDGYNARHETPATRIARHRDDLRRRWRSDRSAGISPGILR